MTSAIRLCAKALSDISKTVATIPSQYRHIVIPFLYPNGSIVPCPACDLRNHEDHGVAARVRVRLEHHLELAAVAALDGQNVELAVFERRPRRVSLEAHDNVFATAVPHYGPADRLRAAIDDPDSRLQRNAQWLRAGGARNQAALDRRHDRRDARARCRTGWFVVFDHNPVPGN